MTPEQFTAKLLLSGLCDYRSTVQPALVSRVIQSVDSSKEKHVFAHGAPSFCKALLLEAIAIKLKEQGKSVLIAENPYQLDDWVIENNRSPVEPDYLLVDNVHLYFYSPAVSHYCGKFIMAQHLKVRTIFGGMSSKAGTDSMLLHRMDITELMPMEEKQPLQENVVTFLGEQKQRRQELGNADEDMWDDVSAAVVPLERTVLRVSTGRRLHISVK